MIDRALRIVSGIIIILIIVQAVTGMLLSLHYTPDGSAAEVRPGEVGTMVHATKELVRGVPKGLADTLARVGEHALVPADTLARVGEHALVPADTLARVGEYALVPAGTHDVVPSGAAASVSLTIERHVVGGSVLRRIHHTNTTLILVALVTLLALLSVRRGWSTHGVVWSAMIVSTVVVLASAFTGRLLPDDVYSNVSKLIVRYELSEAPFGSVVTSVLGLHATEAARLSMPYAIHVLFLPMVLAGGVCLLWRRFGRPTGGSLIGCAFAVACSSVLPVTYYAIRDVRGNVQQAVTAEPWWPFAVPNALVSWFGGELAGYLVVAVFIAAVTLPLWSQRRNL